MSGLLAGLKVVDLGVGMAPALVAKYLAEAGADVTRVPPAGSDPFADYYPAYAIWHKAARVADASKLDGLLADADVCIVGGEDHPDVARRTDAAVIAERNPRLVVLDIAQGPEGTVYAGRPATDLLAQARSGLVWEQDPERPVVSAFEPATYGAALQGLIGTLAALYEREGSGKGQLVSTSLFEGSFAWIAMYWSKLEKPTPAADFVMPRGVSPLVFRCKDGVFIHLVIGGTGSKYGMYKALEIDDPTVQPTDSGMPKPGGSPRNFYGDYDLLAEHVAKKDSKELLEAIWERGLPAEPVLKPGECWDEPQIARNGIIVAEPDGSRHTGFPFLYRLSPNGEPKAPAANSARPLDGIRVLDCGAFVAGPLAGSILADLGADVIKVEANQGDPNRSIFKSFTVANRGKRALGLDLKQPDGGAIFREACASADIVMNNFRPGVSKRLGADPDTLLAAKPDAIVIESPAYGSEGPLALKSGFDMVMQAWCGHEAKAAGKDNDPFWNRTNLVDLHGGQLGAVALLTALVHRARTGNGVAIESPLVNAGLFGMSELLKQPDGSMKGLRELSSARTGYHPSESLYRAADGWVAIVARGSATAELGPALGIDLPADVSAWAEDEERRIGAAVVDQTSEALAALLGPRNIWVEPCRTDMEQRVLGDPVLLERGMVRKVQHPLFGEITELAALYKLSRSRQGNEIAAPVPGGSTREILSSLGYADEQIEQLAEKQVVKVA